MHIISLGTIQKGGIDSVIQGYVDNDLFSNKQHTRIGTHAGAGKFNDVYLFISAIIKLINLCFKNTDVLIHCHMSYKGSFFRKLIFVLIAKVFNHKTIVHLHGSEFKDYYSNSSPSKKKLIVWLINHVDEFVVLSESWQDFINNISGRKVAVINNYVDIEKQDIERVPNQILFLGAFIKRKGIYDLLKSLKNVNSEFHLHLCGAGENNEVQSLINELALNDSVTNHGWVNAKEKTQLLSECSVFILPSYNEGLPMVIIEAMACEIPIITTPVGGIPEVIIENSTGYLVEPGKVEEMALKLDYVLSNNNSIVIANAKRHYLTHFSSKVILPKWEALYSRILTN
ncbi:glycosyltransferase family 4 protein [Paraglaciecola sp.]|uniref:glycosyltransferase family 4 protein n=1 Tax=Paraglaciecola sp. TaxID=1920173 RepID=UPI003263A240